MRKRLWLIVFLLFWIAPLHAAPVLVDTAWIAEHADDPGVILVDLSDDTQYLRFHLPGAVHFDSKTLFVPRRKDRVPVPPDAARVQRLLGQHGITADRHVVLYDDMGGLNAGRLFWALERLGHAEVSVMDGGLVKWILEGRKVVNTPVTPRPVSYVPGDRAGRDNEASLAEVRRIADDDSAVLLDVRSRVEYLGNPREPRSGHVPRARFWPWQETVAFEDAFVRKSADELLETLAAVDAGDKSRPLVAYCRSGHRASQAYLVLRSLGYENVKVYAPSMNEYQRVRDAPLVKGQKPCTEC